MKYLELPDAETPCPYIPGRAFTAENFLFPAPTADQLDYLLSVGFRHFGAYFFRPVCDSCMRCIPLRVRMSDYAPSRSAKRIISKNKHFRITLGMPTPSKETYALYRKHQARFERKGSDSYERYVESFFTATFGNTQISVFDDTKIISVLHLDITGTAVSAVYCYFDTEYVRESLGTFTIVGGLDLSCNLGIHWFYLGYMVEENSHMSYKIRYRPNEILTAAGWAPYVGASGEKHNQNYFSKGFPGADFRANHPFHAAFSR